MRVLPECDPDGRLKPHSRRVQKWHSSRKLVANFKCTKLAHFNASPDYLNLFLVPCRYPFLKLPIGVPYTWHSSHESANSFPDGGA
jgi:hypothetical protein